MEETNHHCCFIALVAEVCLTNKDTVYVLTFLESCVTSIRDYARFLVLVRTIEAKK